MIYKMESTGKALKTTTSSWGRSRLSVSTSPIRLTTESPELTLPKMVCLLSKCGAGARVTKNWLPFELGPLFAMESTPAPVCFRLEVISSENFPPYMESPPLPLPVGSPPWIIKSKYPDDSMKFCVVIVLSSSKFCKIFTCLWRIIDIQLKDNRSLKLEWNAIPWTSQTSHREIFGACLT